jgi:hypothetical protein
MVVHTCERCLCTFNKKSNYVTHQNRKLPCKIVEQKEGNENLCIIMIEMNKMKEQIKHQDNKIQEMDKMKKEMKEMKNIINSQKKIINTNRYEKCNVTQNEKCNVTNNIIAFGKEDLEFITDDVYKKILNKGFGAPCALAKHIHFNKDHPNNQNIHVTNIKDKKFISVNDGDKWIKRHHGEVIDEIKTSAHELLMEKVAILDPDNDKDNKIINKSARFIKSCGDEDNEALSKYDDDLELMLYNNRNMPKNTCNLIIDICLKTYVI